MKAAARPQIEETELYEEKPRAPAARIPEGERDITRIVQMPTWREVLMDLVHTNQIDPWNIDVVEITRAYVDQVRKMTMNDLRVPANLILAAAILLRFKSDMLRLDEPVAQTTLDAYEDSGPVGDIPLLELRGRIPPKRRVTLDELVSAVEEVFERERRRDSAPTMLAPPPAIEIKLAEFNLDTEVAALQQKLASRKDGEGLVLFSALLDEPTRHAVVYTFLPLLFLTQRGEVSMAQEPFFGEIIIRTGLEKKADGGKKGKGSG
ncbi:Segregation and condensation protein A [uncultured archaeon]|nr:Segregation and condensation protein A [uncultured archaeon]